MGDEDEDQKCDPNGFMLRDWVRSTSTRESVRRRPPSGRPGLIDWVAGQARPKELCDRVP